MSRASRLMVAVLVSALWGIASSAQSTLVRFVDVAAEAGLNLVNVSGGPSKDFIVDANGNGAAFLDYDNDRDLDVLIVNGSTREHITTGGDPMVALYRQDEGGRFTDVTASSGFTRRGWGSGGPFYACPRLNNQPGDSALAWLKWQWFWEHCK